MDKQTNNGGSLPAGMTLRDYFAAKAMQGYLSHEAGANAECRTLAGWAYEMADAMLAARGPVTAEGEGWTKWAGGERPVAAGTVVDVQLACGEEFARRADWLNWGPMPDGRSIVAYRVVRDGGAE